MTRIAITDQPFLPCGSLSSRFDEFAEGQRPEANAWPTHPGQT
ncbi:hypothetical protein [Pseudomonas sp. PIC25]|nr:hypothetical protein [Pseudomonas sp. PIC25]